MNSASYKPLAALYIGRHFTEARGKMKFYKIPTLVFALLFVTSSAFAQRAEITVSLNEQFFDTFLDALYQNGSPPEFPLSQNRMKHSDTEAPSETAFVRASYAESPNTVCTESIKMLREMNGVRTAVRFREGRIYVPLAFSGSYSPPFVGCVDFAGWAEANVDLEFDQAGQKLLAKMQVLNVSLNGTGGVGGNVVARLVQSAIDKKINPLEVLQLDKISFVVPIQNSGRMRMKAVGIRHEVANGALNVHIAYEFVKA